MHVFSLGDGETSIDDKYSNPVMHKDLEPTNGCWTIEIGNDTYNFASQNQFLMKAIDAIYFMYELEANIGSDNQRIVADSEQDL